MKVRNKEAWTICLSWIKLFRVNSKGYSRIIFLGLMILAVVSKVIVGEE